MSFTKDDSIKIQVLKVKQPIGEFYVGIAKADDANLICSAVERKHEKDELEEYLGIQRTLDKKRVDEIKQYVRTWDACFPNSIILSINRDCYFIEGNFLYIKKGKDSANIIDGQHRLAGFDETYGRDFELVLAMFPELDFEEQAYLFSVINTKMTRINPSLAQDLYELATIHTPEKLTHNIAKNFNMEEGNPWYQKIKMLGKRESPDSEATLSQSTFSKKLIELIYDSKSDLHKVRDILKKSDNRRDSLKSFYDPSKVKKYILWEPYFLGEDKFIFTVLRDFFIAVVEVYGSEWRDSSKILTKTTGYAAQIKVFEKLYRIGYEQKDLTKTFFLGYFKKCKGSDKIKDFTSINYPPGTSGETRLTNDFIAAMGLDTTTP